MALLTDGAYALLAGSLRQWLSGRVMRGASPRYLSGFLYLGLGVNAALTGQRNEVDVSSDPPPPVPPDFAPMNCACGHS